MENGEFNPTDISVFEKELDLIDESIDDIDELYNEIKDHFDLVKNSRSHGSLSFVEKQTSNLVSLKSAKISMVKERINIKKIQADLHYKNERSKSDESSDNSAIVKELAKHLMVNDMAVNQIEDKYEGIITDKGDIHETKPKVLEESVDDLLAKRLSQLEKSGEVSYTDNEVSISYENQSVAIVVLKKGKAWKFGAMDNSGKIIKGYPVPEKKDFTIKLVEEDDELVAVDQNDKVYKVIKIG